MYAVGAHRLLLRAMRFADIVVTDSSSCPFQSSEFCHVPPTRRDARDPLCRSNHQARRSSADDPAWHSRQEARPIGDMGKWVRVRRRRT